MQQSLNQDVKTLLETNNTHLWTWEDYPSPREATYWKCGVSKPTYVCDPDKMLTDDQRKEIVELVEDFKKKTKRPNSKYLCMREGVRLVVALAKVKVGPGDGSSGLTVCFNGSGVAEPVERQDWFKHQKVMADHIRLTLNRSH
uniref:Uncharacterized protein n=1 Tax=Meloidogyne incognita TaxID=6306 RepID=A0A914LFI6_MELIC